MQSARDFATHNFFLGQEYNEQALRDFLQFQYHRYVQPEEDPAEVYQQIFREAPSLKERPQNLRRQAVSLLKKKREKPQFDSAETLVLKAALRGIWLEQHHHKVHTRHQEKLLPHLIKLQVELKKEHEQEELIQHEHASF